MRYEKSLRSLRALKGGVPQEIIREADELYILGFEIDEIDRIINSELDKI